MAAHPPPSALEAARIEALANGRYHSDREAHLDRVHRVLIALVIILGASALVKELPNWAQSLASISSAILGTIDLTFAVVERARAHAVLRERYFDIAAALAGPSADPAAAQREMLTLAGKEEPVYLAVHALAENWATCSVLGAGATPPCKVPPKRRFFRHWFRQDSYSFAA